MASRSNLYKNPSFSYRKSYSIASVLQNLHAYTPTTLPPPPLRHRPMRRRRRRRSKRRSVDRWMESTRVGGRNKSGRRRRRGKGKGKGIGKGELCVMRRVLCPCPCHTRSILPEHGRKWIRRGALISSFLRMFCKLLVLVCNWCSAIVMKDLRKLKSCLRNQLMTDDDVCSIDCKAEILQQRQALLPKNPVGTRALNYSTHRLDTSPSLTECEQDAWDYEKN